MLFKALEGLWPVYGGRGRYPGMYRWTDHLHPDKLKPGKVGYHLPTEAGIENWLGPDIYEAIACPDHEPIEWLGFTETRVMVTCRTKLVRKTSWNRIALSQAKAANLVGVGMDNLPIQLRWDWEYSMPDYIQDWVRPGVKGFMGHESAEAIDAWIRGRHRQKPHRYSLKHRDRLLEALTSE